MPRTLSRRPEQPPLLLDTHVWLWLVQGDPTLSPGTRQAIQEAARRGAFLISVISIWEVAMLSSRNRLALDRPVAAWIEGAIARSGAAVEPLSPEILVDACHLPGRFRSDPADEIIVATARVSGAVLMTRDRRILDYAGSGRLAAVPA